MYHRTPGSSSRLVRTDEDTRHRRRPVPVLTGVVVLAAGLSVRAVVRVSRSRAR
ncbi:hypothetical protein Ae168Ps1_0149 [Pseudonocardia sp. Ae168_Ps1]|nr:hypothetical protein Ae150APs1_0153 [Pseudonocardia sp. Ae150A_Ps1]OLL77743.1 hypothetical protein Ae168Ps1_0149 [Pseudonocardia sp. Ae168_Ps1]OLL88134.1 hypothetical protein Ae263Ps1_5189c [Pseudonocardia sp. Ae263_Ps1]OLL91840.1 hypothetical protein Ae356Ps1_1737 [Pseudonocardia sp. Ae356_Ps1]